jgi:2-phospho-L-lactate transferase/gluconeogenesis factor (CofD/UPF0052 family)
VCNLVTKPGQTDDFSVSDFADEIERLAGGTFLDSVLFNTEQPTEELMRKYAKDGELPVDYEREKLHDAPYIAAGADLLAGKAWKNINKSDPIGDQRTLIRHDSNAVVQALLSLYESYGAKRR